MGNFYVKPDPQGNSPYTRSGLPPPKTLKKSGSNEPTHRVYEPMSLELHMADERMRAAGLSPAERDWRKKWLHDQHLHPDEPIMVDAVNRQLNPIRLLYRWPWDKLYKHFLRPTFGVYHGTWIRIQVPKMLFALLIYEVGYYLYKYEGRSWDHHKGIETHAEKEYQVLRNYDDIESRYPGIVDRAFTHPDKYNYDYPQWHKRVAYLDVGETRRPW